MNYIAFNAFTKQFFFPLLWMFFFGLEIVDKYRAPSRPAKNIEGLENLTDSS